MKTYPDISTLLESKAKRRRRLASLPFEEKISIVEKWRRLSRQIARIRQAQRLDIDASVGVKQTFSRPKELV
jgi:hypothetical protein